MTAIPRVIDYLLDLLRNHSDMEGVQIEDGPPLQRPDAAALIVVGWVPEEGETVTWGSSPTALDDSEGESFSLQGLVSYLDSSDTPDAMKNARDQADALLERLRALIKANRRLGGAVNRSELVTVGASPDQSEDGAEWAIRWAINARKL